MNFQKAILLSFILFSSGAWASDYIVGGQSVQRRDPIQASTVGIFDPSADGRTGALCTGTLIGKNMAVTAAHCIQPGNAKNPLVIFGNDLHSPDAIRRHDGPAAAIAIQADILLASGPILERIDAAAPVQVPEVLVS